MQPDALLENLDPEQREAAESLIGPTCILAGAGTGKTRTVTHRIAYGIAKGYFRRIGFWLLHTPIVQPVSCVLACANLVLVLFL